jgi:hypothetical protein
MFLGPLSTLHYLFNKNLYIIILFARDTKEGAVISLLIAVYLAFQHFSRTSLQKSFDQGSIIATLAVISITVTSLVLLI